jgi:hypothetical protein
MYEDFEEQSMVNNRIRMELLKRNFNQENKQLGCNSNPISRGRSLSITTVSV